METELQHGIGKWNILREGFLTTFLFEDQWMDTVDDALQLIKATIFITPLEPAEVVPSNWSRQLSQALACYNVQIEDDEDDPHNFSILESVGSREVHGPKVEDSNIMVPLKIK